MKRKIEEVDEPEQNETKCLKEDLEKMEIEDAEEEMEDSDEEEMTKEEWIDFWFPFPPPPECQ